MVDDTDHVAEDDVPPKSLAPWNFRRATSSERSTVADESSSKKGLLAASVVGTHAMLRLTNPSGSWLFSP